MTTFSVKSYIQTILKAEGIPPGTSIWQRIIEETIMCRSGINIAFFLMTFRKRSFAILI